MLLAIDIGNSNITMGVFEDKIIKDIFRMVSDLNIQKNDYEFLIKKMISDYKIDGCIISSVVDELTPVIEEACFDIFGLNPIIVKFSSKLPIDINVNNPEKVGADRLVNVSSAVLYEKLPAVVVDFGTATTIDVLSSDKEFIGGVIMPGIKMQAKSLTEKTSKLPDTEIRESVSVIGKDTIECINSGVLRGTASAADGIINQIEQELGEKVTLIVTGGLCETVTKYMNRRPDIVNKNLTLEGLNFLYTLNIQCL